MQLKQLNGNPVLRISTDYLTDRDALSDHPHWVKNVTNTHIYFEDASGREVIVPKQLYENANWVLYEPRPLKGRSRQVKMFDKDGNYLATFSGSMTAANLLYWEFTNCGKHCCYVETIAGLIRKACSGKRKTAYGYEWRWGL